MAPTNEAMGDLELELLALAGAQSGAAPVEPSRSSSSPQPRQSTPLAADSKSSAAPQKGVARKMNKRTAASRPRLTVEVDEEEEEEEA